MEYKYKVSVAAAETPISLIEAKEFLRLTSDYTEEDNLISSFIRAATTSAENFMQRDIVEKTYLLYLNDFIDPIEIQKQVTEVVSIVYKDINGGDQTLSSSDYITDLETTPALITSLSTFPATYADSFNNVTVTFKSGFGAATEVPDDIKTALFYMISKYYDDRADSRQNLTMPKVSECFLSEYKIISGSWLKN